MVDFPWRPVAVAFAWSVVDSVVHGLDLTVADVGEVGALGEVLADKAVGVLVAAALPWMVGQREVTDGSRGGLDLFEVGELHATVQGDGARLRTPGEGLRLHFGDVAFGVRPGASARQQAASAVDERDQAGARAPAHDGVALPVAQSGTLLHFGRTLADGPCPGDFAAPLLGPALAVPAFALVAQPRLDAASGALQVRRVEPASVDRPVLLQFFGLSLFGVGEAA